jgi:hypothetical protein
MVNAVLRLDAWIRDPDPGWKKFRIREHPRSFFTLDPKIRIWYPGSGINIPDPHKHPGSAALRP